MRRAWVAEVNRWLSRRAIRLIGTILTTFPAEAAQEVLNMGARSLNAAIENGATVLRATAPEDEVKRFGDTIRKAYSARLIVLLAEPAGRG